MRKYAEISKAYLKIQLIWRADAIVDMIFAVGKIAFAYLLWGIIFTGKETVAGFTFMSMLSYYIISSFLSQLDKSADVSTEMADMIRNGTFSKYMVIPVNIQRYFLAITVGKLCFSGILNLLAACVWVLVFKIRFTFSNHMLFLLCGIFMVVLGLYFMVQLNYFLGILTLKFQEISTFLMIKDNLVILITGAIIPLALMPDWLLSFMKLFPFYYVTYLPSMLFIGKCEEEAFVGILVLLVWCLAFFVINKITYERYRIKFDGVGI